MLKLALTSAQSGPLPGPGCLIFHFIVPRSPFLVLVTSRLTVVRLEETSNIQTIHANFVRVIAGKKKTKVYQLTEVDSYRKRQPAGAPNENIVKKHLNIALLNVL